ncbi:hypothetical protein BMS3Abin10_01093 [bacterium BMS3Abin10]|nr:hypothetical protein BMS3Abin10_01093 [bacterium BMS3Abin10]GBE38157.1 hypothetical protein BMS3Bbin08_00760 [bacterium BMS3Bbin08]
MRRLIVVFSVICFIALLFFLLRGPHLSNAIKRAILPVLEDATGESIIIDSAVINLFPFYLQTKGFKVFDEDGNKLLHITKMRAYIDLLGLFSGELRIRRLTVKEPELTADRKVLDEIIRRVGKHTGNGDGPRFSVSLKNLRLYDGKFTLTDMEKQMKATGNGINIDMLARNAYNVTVSLKQGTLKLPDLPEMSAGLDGRIKISDDRIKVSEAKIYVSDSTFRVRGEVYPASKGEPGHGGFTGKAKILVKTIGKIFGLQESKDGELTVSGSVDLVPSKDDRTGRQGPKVELDLETEGWFYLETLMELLKVDENIKGRISLKGRIRGFYPDVTGEGTIEVEDAVIDTLPMDDIKGKISYQEEKFKLDDFVAHTYDGELKGRAVIFTDGGYSIDASVKNVNSPGLFEFIKWDPPFTPGKISGNFSLNRKPGMEIELTAGAEYVNTSINAGNLIEERLKNIQTDIDMEEGVLTLSNAVLTTSLSSLFIDGSIDLLKKKLDLDVTMRSDDAVDFTAPDFKGLRAPVSFAGRAEGSTLSPVISGSIKIGPGTVNGEKFNEATAEITYSPEALHTSRLSISQDKALYEVSGSIDFRKSEGLFSFKDPYYRARATIMDGDAASLIAASLDKLPISGLINGSLFFEGDSEEFGGSGSITVEDSVVYGQPIDRAVIKAEFSPENINFSSVEIQKNRSSLRAGGSVYFDNRFNVSVKSDGVDLKDLAFAGGKYPVDARFSVDAEGSGTFKNPRARFSLSVLESYFRDVLIGKADIKGELKDKSLSVQGSFLDGIATAEASLVFSETLPWEVNMEFNSGRYDFLLAGLLKDVPRDISASLEGMVRLKGQKGKFSMSSRFSSLLFNLYGYNFINNEDVVLELSDDVFRIGSLSIHGGSGNISATGSVKIGQDYDLKVDGKINLAPLKAVTETFDLLRGRGSFSVSVTGPWESPEFRGEINIRDGAAVLSGLPYRIESVNGDIFLDGNRITLDSLNAEFAGGKVRVSGAGYLDKLTIKNLSLSSVLDGIKIRPEDDVDIVFDGKLFFETSAKKQTLLGDINIIKARYKKRIAWKSWLLKLRQVEEAPSDQASFLGKTALNIYIKGEDNIFIDNNIAKTPVKIDLNVQGNIARYGLVGRIETNEGTIFFRGNEFEIIDASVDFIEPNRVVPVFHIQAETFTRGYRVRLNLDGPSDKFTLSLFSDPPLSDIAILTLLTSGQIDKGSEGLESGIGAGEATAFLTGRLQDVIEERFKYITGFERFEIDPRTTSTGAVSSKVTVGKRLLGERLLVTYSSSIGSTELDVIKLQYKLTDNLSLIGSRDEIGDVGGDIKFRFEFK